MAKNNSTSFKIPPEWIIKSKQMQKVYDEVRKAAGRAARSGAMAMQEVVLNSPTGTEGHVRRNATRASKRPAIGGKYVGPVNNTWGSRIETGNMYNLISASFGKIVPGKDKRYRQSIVASFGWPATAEGRIKDAPSSPLPTSRMPDTPNWRSDPRYIAMQEYGGANTPAMHAGAQGAEAARRKLIEEIRKIKGFK